MCCCQVVFFYIQNKRSSGSLTAETFECPVQTNVLRLHSTRQKHGTAGFKSLERLAAFLQVAVFLSVLQRSVVPGPCSVQVSLLLSCASGPLLSWSQGWLGAAAWPIGCVCSTFPLMGRTLDAVCKCGLEGANCQAWRVREKGL